MNQADFQAAVGDSLAARSRIVDLEAELSQRSQAYVIGI
jgi:hypothetical protein